MTGGAVTPSPLKGNSWAAPPHLERRGRAGHNPGDYVCVCGQRAAPPPRPAYPEIFHKNRKSPRSLCYYKKTPSWRGRARAAAPQDCARWPPGGTGYAWAPLAMGNCTKTPERRLSKVRLKCRGVLGGCAGLITALRLCLQDGKQRSGPPSPQDGEELAEAAQSPPLQSYSVLHGLVGPACIFLRQSIAITQLVCEHYTPLGCIPVLWDHCSHSCPLVWIWGGCVEGAVLQPAFFLPGPGAAAGGDRR